MPEEIVSRILRLPGSYRFETAFIKAVHKIVEEQEPSMEQLGLPVARQVDLLRSGKFVEQRLRIGRQTLEVRRLQTRMGAEGMSLKGSGGAESFVCDVQREF